MPLRNDVGVADAEAIAAIYQDSELKLLALIASMLADGIEEPDWELQQLGRLQALREAALSTLGAANAAAASEIRAALERAYTKGGLAVFADVRGKLDAREAATSARVAAVSALGRDIADGLADAQGGILRKVDDVFREVVARAAATVVTGTLTRTDSAQRAINDLLGRGIQGVEVGRGSMSLPDYVTMAVRTATSRSALAGHRETALANDLNLIVIHPGPRPCDICDYWARGILSIDGTPAGTVTVANILGGEVEVEILGTIEDAQADGYGHPNDRCGEEVYLPGVTDPDIIEREPWDQEGYEAQQQQRELERGIREAKTEGALALTDQAAEDAAQLVADRQAALRDHLAANEELKRQSQREQIGRPL